MGSILLLSSLFMGTVMAESLWQDNAPAANLFSDRKAHTVGDILTINISENSSAVRVGNAANSKASSASADAGVGIFKFVDNASVGSADSFKAQGSISNTNMIKAKITVQVVEVKPNGNMLVLGTQSIKQNKEEQTITVTGEVRPDDITSDNTILSSYVANSQIKISGNGPINSKQQQGILTQLFNFLF